MVTLFSEISKKKLGEIVKHIFHTGFWLWLGIDLYIILSENNIYVIPEPQVRRRHEKRIKRVHCTVTIFFAEARACNHGIVSNVTDIRAVASFLEW